MRNSSRSGRRGGSSDSRAAILRAAQRLFARKGYDGTGVRAVAAAAGVDAKMLQHFFGTKAELYAASLQLPVDPAEIAAVLAGERATLGRRIAQFYFGRVFRERAETVLSLVRSAVTHPQAAAMLRRAIEGTVVALLVRVFPGQEAALRGELVASHMIGLFLARHILHVEPLASESDERLIEMIAPALQHYLDDPLPRRGRR